MRIDFDEEVPVSPDVAFGYLRGPTEWPRLYGAFGEVRDLGDGWYAVPMRDGPPLEARVVALDPGRRAAWELRGAYPGRGEVNIARSSSGTRVTGFEQIDLDDALDADTIAALTAAFEAIWQAGWDRLRAESP